ncbi:hypothetical protein AKO1_008315 [Acrasis kona]|uniref:Pinin/SDK/MemA protein domain-containing protein n=1 Tax=Acrasis kona TaxID=1008807 RepID=A0AAW2YNR2_9EUKA
MTLKGSELDSLRLSLQLRLNKIDKSSREVQVSLRHLQNKEGRLSNQNVDTYSEKESRKRQLEDRHESEEHTKKRKLSSVVVGKSNIVEEPKTETPKKPVIKDVKVKERGKRVMGFLMGVLNKSKNELDKSSDKLKHKEEIEKRITEREQKHDKEMAEMELVQVAAQKESKTLQMDSLDAKRKELKYALKQLEEHNQDLLTCHLLRTTTLPMIYYQPKKLTEDQQQKIDEQIKKAKDDTDLFKKKFESYQDDTRKTDSLTIKTTNGQRVVVEEDGSRRTRQDEDDEHDEK